METNFELVVYQPNSTVQELVVIHLKGFVDNTDGQRGSLLFAILLGFVALNLAGKGYIIWFVKWMAPKRPLNTMILTDQVLVLLCTFFLETSLKIDLLF